MRKAEREEGAETRKTVRAEEGETYGSGIRWTEMRDRGPGNGSYIYTRK